MRSSRKTNCAPPVPSREQHRAGKREKAKKSKKEGKGKGMGKGEEGQGRAGKGREGKEEREGREGRKRKKMGHGKNPQKYQYLSTMQKKRSPQRRPRKYRL